METLGVLLVLAVSIYPVALAQNLVTTGSIEANVGEQAVFTCEVPNFDVFTQTVKWVKVDAKDVTVTKEISSHITVSYNEQRYSVKAANVPGKGAKYTFTITDIQPEDDGSYRCMLESGGNLVEEARESLTVRQPVKAVTLLVGNYKVGDSEEIQKFELDTFDPNMVIGCKVRGSNPAAKVMMKIGEEDVTAQLTRGDEVTPKGPTFKAVRVHSTDLDSTGVFTLTTEHLNKEISCSAWVPGIGPEKKVAKAMLTVKEPPKVECNNVTSRLGDRRVKLICSIKSLAKPQEISWFVDNENPMFIPTNNEQKEEYIATQNSVDDKTVQVTLEIGVVKEKHFATLYELRAKVSQSDLSHAVRLHSSGSTGGQGTVTIATTLMASVVFLGVLLKRLM